MAPDHVKEIELLRKLELDYLRAHHELMWELLSKQTLLQWRLFTKYDAWSLNGAIVSYVEISIRSLNILEKIGLYDAQQSNLAHRFLREWRNLNHHEVVILFEAFDGKIRLGAGESSEVMEIPAGFYTFHIIHQMQAVKKPQKGLKTFLEEFGIASGSNPLGQISTLSGAIAANHDFLLAVFKDAHRCKWESLPSAGVQIPGFVIGSAFLAASNHAAIGDEIWKA
jgi:hypothetical protein